MGALALNGGRASRVVSDAVSGSCTSQPTAAWLQARSVHIACGWYVPTWGYAERGAADTGITGRHSLVSHEACVGQ